LIEPIGGETVEAVLKSWGSGRVLYGGQSVVPRPTFAELLGTRTTDYALVVSNSSVIAAAAATVILLPRPGLAVATDTSTRDVGLGEILGDYAEG
jgi:hypothetical protein